MLKIESPINPSQPTTKSGSKSYPSKSFSSATIYNPVKHMAMKQRKSPIIELSSLLPVPSELATPTRSTPAQIDTSEIQW